MWLRVIVAMALLIVATFVIQILISRSRARTFSSRHYAMWDVAPVTGFLGAVLLALSFAEAARREAIEAWRWGIALGLLLSGCLAAAVVYRWNHRVPKIADPVARNGAIPGGKETAARALLSLVRTYGLGLLFAILGVTLAVRFVGAALEVFIAGALGTFIVAMALGVFAIAWRYKSASRRQMDN